MTDRDVLIRSMCIKKPICLYQYIYTLKEGVKGGKGGGKGGVKEGCLTWGELLTCESLRKVGLSAFSTPSRRQIKGSRGSGAWPGYSVEHMAGTSNVIFYRNEHMICNTIIIGICRFYMNEHNVGLCNTIIIAISRFKISHMAVY